MYLVECEPTSKRVFIVWSLTQIEGTDFTISINFWTSQINNIIVAIMIVAKKRHIDFRA